MAGKKTSVSKINEIHRLIELKMSDRAIARALMVSRNTVASARMESSPVEQRPPPGEEEPKKEDWSAFVDWESIQRDFRAGTTLTVLWQEQVENGTVTVQYPAFWKHFSKKFPESKQSMHRVFAPGSRTEIDYCDGIDFYSPSTGEVLSTQLFVGVLCHSRYAFAEFTLSQKSRDFLSSHVRMFEFFGGVSEVISPDNLKSAVIKTHRYDPEINPAYTRLAEHYEIGVVPARVKTPKDKAIVERTIQIFQRWFYGVVRKRTFTSLIELNLCLKEHLVVFNEKVHRIFRRSRAEMFMEEKKHLRSLPVNLFQVSTHSIATVHPDCHLSFEKNFYSVPHQFRGQKLDVWVSENLVEIFSAGERIAVHRHHHGHGKFMTLKTHYPESHQAYADTTISSVCAIAKNIGPQTQRLIDTLLGGEAPLRHLRRAQGIVRLGKDYPHAHLEEACKKALDLNQSSFGFIERVLKNKKVEMTNAVKMNSSNQVINRGENPFLRGDTLLN